MDEHTRSCCITGESNMKDFTSWWESHLPSYLIACCRSGEAELKLRFKAYRFQSGMWAIIPPDMFPSFSSMSESFNAFFCLVSRDFMDKSCYDLPYDFFNALYVEPILKANGLLDAWMPLLSGVNADSSNQQRESILSDLLHAFTLDYYDKWKRLYGDRSAEIERSPAEYLCMRFYNLVFDHFREHRATTYYAEKLCITPNYLAMITRQICDESPKQAINRQVTMEMMYMLRNTTMTAEQIALHLHFPDTSYMCRFFRRQTGFSLSEYRKKP